MARTAFLETPGVVAMAHRGFSGPRGDHRLENSMAAFAAAVDLGFTYVETDVHATSDGVLLAFHDDTLDRVTDRSGVVAQLPWSTVREARIGGSQPIPLLEELLTTWPELKVNIDVKSASAVRPTIEVIERTRAHDRVCVASFSDHRRLAVIDGLSRPVATSAGQRVITSFVLLDRWLSQRLDQRLGALAPLHDVDALQLPERSGRFPVVTRGLIEAAHSRGVQVHVWTINDTASMHRLLDLGVDGIMTDRADLLADVLRQRGR